MKALRTTVIAVAAAISMVSINAQATVAECCQVTVENPETGESASVKKCATTFKEACEEALEKAVAALD